MNILNISKNNIDNNSESVNQSETNQDSAENIIPPQYDGLPSEVVEELWTNPVYLDEKKNQTEIERRQSIIDQIKANENTRENEKRNQLTEQYSQLPDDDKSKFSDAQNNATKIAYEFIKGERELTELTDEEEFVVSKIKSTYENFKKENPDKKFILKLAKDIDKQVWDNLNYRLAFDVLDSQKNISDQEEANKAREEIGISTREINDKNLLLPKEEQEKGIENFDSIIKNEYRKYGKEYYNKVRGKTEEEAKMLIKRFEKRPTKYMPDTVDYTTGVIKFMYGLIRLHNYKKDDNYDSKIEEVTEARTDKMDCLKKNGWHYRLPIYEKNGKKYTKVNKADFRISLNVNGDKNLIKELDEYISKINIKKPGSVYYKTPDDSENWLARHDPVTVYFEDDAPDEVKENIVNITKPYIRSTEDVLPGEKLSDGVSYELSPSKEKLQKLISRGYAINQESGDAIKQYIVRSNIMEASAGQVSAIEKFLKEFEKK